MERSRSPKRDHGAGWINPRKKHSEEGATLHELNATAIAPLGQEWDVDFISMELLRLHPHFGRLLGSGRSSGQAPALGFPKRPGGCMCALHITTFFFAHFFSLLQRLICAEGACN